MLLCNTVMLDRFISVMSALLRFFLGPADGVLWTLVIFWITEYITNFCVVIIRKRSIQQIGIHWFIKKIGILCVVSLSTYVDIYIMGSMSLRNTVMLYYISNSGISIFKNISKIGVPVPKILKDAMRKIVDRDKQL